MALRPSHDDNVPKLDTTEEAHLKLYKNNAKHEDMRCRRNETTVEIRKQKGAQLLMKRRNQLNDENEDGEVSDIEGIELPNTKWLANGEIINVLNISPTIEQARTYLEALRRRLSRSKNPPIDEVIKSGLLHVLVQALGVEDDGVRLDAAWALTNIVSGTHVQALAVVEAGATLPLIQLTQSPNKILSEQALWAVANIAGDSPQLRDHIIECDGLNALMALVDRLDSLDSSCARTLARAFCNMCLHRNPHAPIQVLEVLSRGLSRLITHPVYLHSVIKLLRNSDVLAIPALCVFGSMSTGYDDSKQGDFQCQFEASWAVANLARGGTAKQVLCLLEENAIPTLCVALTHTNVDLLNNILETLHTLLNAVSSCCPERFDEVRNSVEENGGFYRMERLQESESVKSKRNFEQQSKSHGTFADFRDDGCD
ncbi:hypothetical protein KIN20_009126 [Parelaphostrongylus tenuis]|uniref:IBB domain-containing protein n=1 Tax=Parelaphostrongylus tenuis TaxID=148309 RepID=A0AAD5QN56_PARTN|nr:hypothetical protein KIN20_009126 [Parelaphostrongylus tenuis]